MNLKKLAAEFPREQVSWRVQGKPYEHNGQFSAMALAYIDARDAMDRLDDVCGPENWQDKYEVLPSGLYVAHIGIRCGDQWVWKSDGAGETQVEGKKGGISDAFKRCAVKWGIGRYLYRLDSPWVRCEVRKANNGVAWKKWIEDPWSKAKQTSYAKAEAVQQNPDGEKETPDTERASQAYAAIKCQVAGQDLLAVVTKYADVQALPFVRMARVSTLRNIVGRAQSAAALDALARAFAPDLPAIQDAIDKRKAELEKAT